MFRPRFPDIEKPKYFSIYRIHVRKLASYVAIISLIFNLFTIPFAINDRPYLRLPIIGAEIIGDFTPLLADKYEKPDLYVPFLIVTGVLFAYDVTELYSTFKYIISLPEEFDQLALSNNTKFSAEEFQNTETSHMLVPVGIFLFMAACLMGEIYSWLIVKKARKYMKKEVVTGNVAKQPRIAIKV